MRCYDYTNNAFWSGSQFYFGKGDVVTSDHLCVLDVCAHEYGHALTDYSSVLTYSYESGALNESYSDIAGATVEFWAQPDGRSAYPWRTPGHADWLMGEDCWVSDTALRDMRNPQRHHQPSYYKGTYWYTGSGDYGGVHDNNGVQNFVFYLLSEGGTGVNDSQSYAVTGIGVDSAANIALQANLNILVSTSQYRDSRAVVFVRLLHRQDRILV
jgi:Zn-dependent metalloprotease